MEIAGKYLETVIDAARAVDLDSVLETVAQLERVYSADKTVYVIGNGGSAASASHLAQDLAKATLPDACDRRLRALSLADSSPFITAVGNDLGFAHVFEYQLRTFARPDDLLIAISGSGNSPDIILAVEYARKLGLTVIGLTGFDGGKLGGLAHVHINVPLHDMCKAEAVHGIITHMIPDLLRERLVVRPSCKS